MPRGYNGQKTSVNEFYQICFHEEKTDSEDNYNTCMNNINKK